MENINSLEAALGFMAGCGATGTVLWAAIISPLKSDLKAERTPPAL